MYNFSKLVSFSFFWFYDANGVTRNSYGSQEYDLLFESYRGRKSFVRVNTYIHRYKCLEVEGSLPILNHQIPFFRSSYEGSFRLQ